MALSLVPTCVPCIRAKGTDVDIFRFQEMCVQPAPRQAIAGVELLLRVSTQTTLPAVTSPEFKEALRV